MSFIFETICGNYLIVLEIIIIKKIKLVDPNISNALFYAFKIADNLWKTKIVKSYIDCHIM